MLTDSNDLRNHDEIIVEKGKHCTHFESGNPFLSDQEFIYSSSDHLYQQPSTVSDSSLSDMALAIVKNNLESSLIRLKRHPNNPHLVNTLALNYQKSGNVEKAISTLEDSLTTSPDFFQTKANLAQCYFSIDRIDDAISLYKTLEAQGQGNEVIFNNIALMYLKKGKTSYALEYFEKAQRINSKNASTWNNLGIIYLAKNNINKAISNLRKAYSLNNNDSNIANNVGVAFAIQGNIKKALRFFKVSNELQKGVRRTLLNLATTYQLLNKNENVVELLRDYLVEHDSEIELRNILAFSYFKLAAYNDALKQLLKAIKNVGTDNAGNAIGLINNIAAVYENLGHSDKAEEMFIKCLEMHPRASVEIHCNIIHMYLAKNDTIKAKERIDNALEIYEKAPVFISYLGEYYLKIGEYDTAKKLFYSLIESNPEFVLPYVSLTTILADVEENFEEALSIIEKVYREGNNSQQVINNYAYVLIQLGELSRARTVLDKVDHHNTLHLMATRGLLLMKEGDIKEGRAHYNRAKKLAGKKKNLANLVEQKKQLELGRYYLANSNKAKAIRHLTKGIDIKTKETYYKKQTQKLLNQLTDF